MSVPERLELWNSYLKIIRNAFQPEEYFIVLGKFTKEFGAITEVKDDRRVVNRFIEYAQASNHPMSVYDYMHKNKIGTSLSFLYYYMAEAFEKKKQFYHALNVYREGLKSVNEKDKAELLNDLEGFKERMCQRICKKEGNVEESRKRKRMTQDKEAIISEARELDEMYTNLTYDL